jgi:RNA polymerase-interacting CarD/CdnL/TRCF family regulator
MDFHVGDPVVHWTHGLGKIIGLEQRSLAGEDTLYYVVQVQDLTVCVPADDKAIGRLRFPTPKNEFNRLFGILSAPGESLSDDRRERKMQLHNKLENGKAESVCQVIRDLHLYEQKKPLNDDDKNILKRARNSLLGEWGFSLSLPIPQIELELHRLLGQPSENAVA